MPFGRTARFLTVFVFMLTAISATGIGETLRARQAAPSAARVLGTLQNISGKSITVISDSGVSAIVSIEDSTRFLEIEPGITDLQQATPITFADLQAGDRVLARGPLAEDGKTLRAASIVAIKKSAIADKQAKERAEWQRGVGGLVKSIDPAAQTVSITTNGFSVNKEVLVRLSKDTVVRRYAVDSTRFDAAKVAPFSEIHAGDQLRARGTRSTEGNEFAAVEIVSGTFRSIAGTIASADAAAGTLVVQDLASKSSVTLKITPESQMRKLPAQFAEGLASRLKAQNAGPAPSSAPAPGGAPVSPQGTPAATEAAGTGANGGRGGDFQQMIARMPAAALADLQKGEAVMVVTTQGNGKDPLTVITLLGGVEAILRASPKGGQDMILSPWSLGGGEPAGN